jgi:peptide/nickel transport system permease protein
VFQRLLRADMVGTLQNDFITMARAKGMSTARILFRHALRPSTFSLITAAAYNVGALIGGAVIVETIFALPGMGDLVVQAIFRRDFLVVQFCVVLLAVGFVVINFLVDLLYNVLDPRIRHARALI